MTKKLGQLLKNELSLTVVIIACLAGGAIHVHSHEMPKSGRESCLGCVVSHLPGAKKSSAYTYVSTAVHYLVKGNLKEALTFANLALQKDSNLAIGFITRGMIYSEMDEPQKALADLDKGRSLDSSFKETHFKDVFSWVYIDLQDWDAAASETKDAIKSAPKETWRYKQLGEIYDNRHRYELALNAYSAGLKEDPKNEGILRARAGCYVRQHRYKEALADYSSAIAVAPNPVSYGCRADVYEKLGQKDMAEKDRDVANRKGFRSIEGAGELDLLKP